MSTKDGFGLEKPTRRLQKKEKLLRLFKILGLILSKKKTKILMSFMTILGTQSHGNKRLLKLKTYLEVKVK